MACSVLYKYSTSHYVVLNDEREGEMKTTVQKLRNKMGLTQVEVAKKSNITEVSYQRIEYGTQKPSLVTAQLIAKALDSTVEKLFPIDYLLQQADENERM